jgi:hypothetical protein
MAGYVNVRAYAELNDFMEAESRGRTARRPFRPIRLSRTFWRRWAFRIPRSTSSW